MAAIPMAGKLVELQKENLNTLESTLRSPDPGKGLFFFYLLLVEINFGI